MSELGFKVPPTGHKVTETGPRFKVSSKRPKKWGIDLAIPELVVLGVIHYTTAAPSPELKKLPLLTWQYILKREDDPSPPPPPPRLSYAVSKILLLFPQDFEETFTIPVLSLESYLFALVIINSLRYKCQFFL